MNEEKQNTETIVELYKLQRNIIYDIHSSKAKTKRQKLETLLKDVKDYTESHKNLNLE